MALDQHNRAHIEEFFANIAGHSSAFRQDTFSYVALRDGDRWVLISGSLVLHAADPMAAERHFECAVAKAGVIHLSMLGLSAAQFVEQLAEGAIETPHGRLEFPAAEGSVPPRHAVSHTPYNPAGNQARLDTAQIMGDQATSYIRQPMLDWSLRAANPPYDGLRDLMLDFGVPAIAPAISVFIVAQCCVVIDASSRLNDNKASVVVGLASGLDPAKASVGVVAWRQRTLERRLIPSDEFTWRQDANRQVGEASIKVPAGAVLHCFANYAGIAHHRFWVTDPSHSQNHRRAAFEALGAGVKAISELIAETQTDRGTARRFETAIDWLLWLLGFSPAHLGDIASMQDAPDLIVATPTGHIAAVECTTGMVKHDKLLNLRARALAIRQRLDASSLGAFRVLPVLICARPHAEVDPERDVAAGMGICILDRDDLTNLLDRTALAPDADAFFAEAEAAVAQRTAAGSIASS